MVKLLDREKLRAELEKALNKSVVRAYNAFGQVTLGWDHNVDFDAEQKPLERVITSPDEVFNYVEFGTRPHDIVAKNAPNLVFRTGGFVPKTQPHVLASGAGAQGNRVVSKKVVHHPGTQAREFSPEVAKIVEPYLRAMVWEALVAVGAQGGATPPSLPSVSSVKVSGKSSKPKRAPKPARILPSLKGIKLPNKPK